MKKNDFIIVAVLIGLMFAWTRFYPAFEKKFFPRPEQPTAAVTPVEAQTPETLTAAPLEKTDVAAEAAVQEPAAEEDSIPEQRLTLANDEMELTVSSRGGSVVSAVLKNYPELNQEDSEPVVLDFSAAPALRYAGLPAAGTLEPIAGGLRYTAPLGNGRVFKRTLTLSSQYLVTIEDAFVNQTDEPWLLPGLRLPTGPMSNPAGTSSMAGVSSLGIDTFSGLDGVNHWAKRFNKLSKLLPAGTAEFTTTPEQLATIQPLQPVRWAAAKNKFFVQIITPENPSTGFDFTLQREGSGKKAVPSVVSAALQFAPAQIEGRQTLNRQTRMYIGPKDYSLLKTQGLDQVEVMEFRSMGFWKFMNPIMYPIKVGLLWGLNALNTVVRNYGLAIMLLTIIVRIIFWPITHKGTESMRRMQALQPQLKEIQAKYKDNPQRAQQEVLQFYRDNKVNPMGGCLPMLVQIPVFIALFVVLRSAIELRYSGFLWIRDLSEPENLFAGMIPVVGSLNILPLLMAATMVLQQKMTPSAGDPQQQKMMAIMMPLMMLFFFYTMPSGLVLYWTTSNLIMIVQMLIKRPKPVAAV